MVQIHNDLHNSYYAFFIIILALSSTLFTSPFSFHVLFV